MTAASAPAYVALPVACEMFAGQSCAGIDKRTSEQSINADKVAANRQDNHCSREGEKLCDDGSVFVSL
jgi:hypothetical protein